LFKNILVPIALIAFTDIALQLDNAIAISVVASGVPSSLNGYWCSAAAYCWQPAAYSHSR